MQKSLTRSMLTATILILVMMVALFVVFYPQPIAFWLLVSVGAIWVSFIFMTFLLQMFLQRPWAEQEKRLASLQAQNDVFRFMFDTTKLVGEVAGAAETAERGLQASVETLRSELKLDGCSLRSYREESGELLPVVGCGYRKDGEAKPMPLSAKSGIAGKAIQERRPVFVENPAEEKEFVPPKDSGAPVKSLFSVPLIENGEVIGVLLGSSQEIRKFNEHEREVLNLISARLSSLLRVYNQTGQKRESAA